MLEVWSITQTPVVWVCYLSHASPSQAQPGVSRMVCGPGAWKIWCYHCSQWNPWSYWSLTCSTYWKYHCSYWNPIGGKPWENPRPTVICAYFSQQQLLNLWRLISQLVWFQTAKSQDLASSAAQSCLPHKLKREYQGLAIEWLRWHCMGFSTETDRQQRSRQNPPGSPGRCRSLATG